MTVYKMEIRKGFKTFLIWSLSIAALVATCILLFPQMNSMMEGVNDIFSSMGAFSAAFGMDRLGMGTLLGFYSVECGTMLSLGAALYSALAGITIVGKEENQRSAEFLFTLPVSRKSVLLQKLGALMTEVICFHILNFIISICMMLIIGEVVPFKEIVLLHSAYLLLSIVIASLCFLLSVFPKACSLGVGMGSVFVLYFLSLMANITEKAKPLSFITPFSFANSTDIVLDCTLDVKRIILWLAISVVALISSVLYFDRRDLKC